MKQSNFFTTACICLIAFAGCTNSTNKEKSENLSRAELTLDSLYAHYSVPETELLRENHPFDDSYRATYLATEEQSNVPNPYAYLWPYSGTFSAVNALFEATNDAKYRKILDSKVLPGLEEYFDTRREPYAYASYIRSAPLSDRFYDDNVWIGIDFTDTYMLTKDVRYLDKARLIWDFILSGTDDKLGGGIYWCEQKKGSKNTCSNAPGSVYAFKLFEATKDSLYFHQGKALYEWTKQNLQDPNDCLYFDNINLNGNVDKAKYAYNSGQMLQSAALLFKFTGEQEYLTEAQHIAQACHNYFFTDFSGKNGEAFKLLNRRDVWFTAVMLRGFIELYHLDNNRLYIDTFQHNLAYAWDHAREDTGLFNANFSGEKKDKKKWLLTQAAMVEMYARLASITKNKD